MVTNNITSSSTECGYIWFITNDTKWLMEFKVTAAEIVIQSYLWPIILILGITANICFLLATARFPHIRSTFNSYLVNLAFADLLVLSFGIGSQLRLYHIFSPLSWSWILHNEHCALGCKLIEMLTYITVFVSMSNITLVTYDMYLALCKPLVHRQVNSKKRTYKFILISWIVSIILGVICAFPFCLRSSKICLILPDDLSVKSYPSELTHCEVLLGWYHLFSPIFCYSIFLVVSLINCILCIVIVSRFRLNRRQSQRRLSQTSRSSREKFALSKMLIVNGCAFFVCLIPWHLHLLLTVISGTNIDDLTWIILGKIGLTFLFANSMINPYIYGTCNARYRKVLLKVSQIDLCKKPSRIQSYTVNTKTEA